MRGNPRVVGEEGAEIAVAVLGRVAIVLVVVIGEVVVVVVGNERGGIAGAGTDGSVALHRRIRGAAVDGGGMPELRHAPIRGGEVCLSLYLRRKRRRST